MFKRKDRRVLDERLDQMGREMVRAAGMSEEQAAAAASSPFLYARVRARIAAERGRQAETNAPLSAMLAIAWRAIPAMTLAAAAAASMFWYASVRSMEPVALSDETFFDARRAGMERVVFADTSGLSRDDVLGTLVSQEEQRPSQR